MVNKNGRKGSAFETGVMRWLRERGIFAERLTKAGAKDEGDLVVIVAGQTYILELKNRQKIDLPSFWEEVMTEAKNYAKARGLEEIPPGFVVVKRRSHGIEKSWVVQDLQSWLKERK